MAGAASPVPVVVDPDLHAHGEGDPVPEPPAPVWDDAARADALAAAQTAMTAFARPDVPADAWWAELRPLLSDGGATAYAFVDQTQVPASRVTGPPALAAGADPRGAPYLARVDVPTDAGTYQLLLVRSAAGDPWAVERLDPPSQLLEDDVPPELLPPPDPAAGGVPDPAVPPPGP